MRVKKGKGDVGNHPCPKKCHYTSGVKRVEILTHIVAYMKGKGKGGGINKEST